MVEANSQEDIPADSTVGDPVWQDREQARVGREQDLHGKRSAVEGMAPVLEGKAPEPVRMKEVVDTQELGGN